MKKIIFGKFRDEKFSENNFWRSKKIFFRQMLQKPQKHDFWDFRDFEDFEILDQDFSIFPICDRLRAVKKKFYNTESFSNFFYQLVHRLNFKKSIYKSPARSLETRAITLRRFPDSGKMVVLVSDIWNLRKRPLLFWGSMRNFPAPIFVETALARAHTHLRAPPEPNSRKHASGATRTICWMGRRRRIEAE